MGPTAAPNSVSTSTAPRADLVRFLSGQIRVGASASDSYFESVVRARLRELLITKVAMEMRIERDTARRLLLDQTQGVRLLKNRELYAILYGTVPENGAQRINLVDKAIDMIGEWKE